MESGDFLPMLRNKIKDAKEMSSFLASGLLEKSIVMEIYADLEVVVFLRFSLLL